MRNLVLDLARMLRRAVNQHRAVFFRNRVRDHALEVELVLAADVDPALQAVRRGGDRRPRIAAHEALGRQHERLIPERFLGRKIGFQVLVFDYGEPCCAARLFHRLRGDREDRLAEVLDHRGGEDRIVGDDGAVVVFARNIPGGDHCHDPGRRPDFREVDRLDPRVSPLAHPDCCIERAADLRNVVGIGCFAADVQVSTVVRDRGADAALHS